MGDESDVVIIPTGRSSALSATGRRERFYSSAGWLIRGVDGVGPPTIELMKIVLRSGKGARPSIGKTSTSRAPS